MNVRKGVKRCIFLRCGKHKVDKDINQKLDSRVWASLEGPYFRAEGGVEITKTYENSCLKNLF